MDEREARIRRLLPLVRVIAKRVHRMVPGVDIDDLIGDGSIGLIRAIDGYDPTRGASLEHYAWRLILGKMLNGVRRMDPVTERARREVRDAHRRRYALAVERGEMPSIAEMRLLCPAFEPSLRQAREAVPLSLDHALPMRYDPPLDYGADPAALVDAAVHNALLREWLVQLSERQRRVIAGHYFGERSLRTVGAEMAVSSQRASQIHRSAIERLRSLARAASD